MYLKHFGFARLPFSKSIPADQLFMSAQFEELVARLRYAIQTRSLALVTGEVGSGKTSAIRCTEAGLDRNTHRLVYMCDAHLTPRAFYEYALTSLALRPPYRQTAMKHLFAEVIMDLAENQGIQPILVIDEAHHLSDSMLEELQFILNFRMDSYCPLTLILIGQPQLRATLRLQIYESISQRIALRYHLSGLVDEDETKSYISHHIKVAQGPEPLFTDEAIKRISHYTKRITRVVNNVCSGCLLDAFFHKTKLVENDNVQRVIAELES